MVWLSSNLGLTGSILQAAHGDGEKFLVEGGGRVVAIGMLFAILSAVANGSFAVFFKTRTIRRARIPPLIFNFWACLGVVLSSFLVLLKFKFVFAPQGLLSGLFFVLSFINSFRAVRLLGISVGFGVWAGTAALVSFLAQEVMEARGGTSNMLFAGIAISVTILGVVGVAWSGHMGRVSVHNDESDHTETLIQSQPSFAGWVHQRRPSNVAEQIKWDARYKNTLGEEHASSSFSAGVFSAVLAGALGGLMLIPALQAPPAAQGNAFLPSFAIAVAIITPIVTALPYLSAACEIPDFAVQAAAGPGMVSGIVWNIGSFWNFIVAGYYKSLFAPRPWYPHQARNMLSIMAIFYVGYAVAYPIFQSGIIIAGIWGMLLFEELSGTALITYWASDIVVLIGVILLSTAH